MSLLTIIISSIFFVGLCKSTKNRYCPLKPCRYINCHGLEVCNFGEYCHGINHQYGVCKDNQQMGYKEFHHSYFDYEIQTNENANEIECFITPTHVNDQKTGTIRNLIVTNGNPIEKLVELDLQDSMNANGTTIRRIHLKIHSSLLYNYNSIICSTG